LTKEILLTLDGRENIMQFIGCQAKFSTEIDKKLLLAIMVEYNHANFRIILTYSIGKVGKLMDRKLTYNMRLPLLENYNINRIVKPEHVVSASHIRGYNGSKVVGAILQSKDDRFEAIFERVYLP